jgi:transcription antitermination factor NusG
MKIWPMDSHLLPGAAVRITAGPYDGFLARVLAEPELGAVRVAVVLFGADQEVTVPLGSLEPTEEPASRPRVVSTLPNEPEGEL